MRRNIKSADAHNALRVIADEMTADITKRADDIYDQIAALEDQLKKLNRDNKKTLQIANMLTNEFKGSVRQYLSSEEEITYKRLLAGKYDQIDLAEYAYLRGWEL